MEQRPSHQDGSRRGRRATSRRPRQDLGLRGYVTPLRTDVGRDPDYRFTLANERTFLSWMRTALALVAGGLVLLQLSATQTIPWVREVLGGGLVALGTLVAAGSYRRWAGNEEAMRTGAPFPASRLPALLAVGVTLLVLAAAVVFVVDAAGST